jgi:hypothetical protein
MSDMNPMPPSMPITDIRMKADLNPNQSLDKQNSNSQQGTIDAVKSGEKTGSI